MRHRTASIVALGIFGIAAGPAAAAGPTIRVSPGAVRAGQVVRVYGAVPGCARGNQVTLISRAFSHAHDFAGLPAVYARVAARGAYSTRTRIPAARGPGTYRISGRCGGGNLGVSRLLRVLLPAGTRSCANVVVRFRPEGSGGAVGIRATNVGCTTARTVARQCISGHRTAGWRFSLAHGRYTITSGRRRITYVAVGGGGCGRS